MTTRKLLPIKYQISMTDRVRCDLIKEQNRLREKGEIQAADICQAHADCLYDVIETLKSTARMSKALSEILRLANA